MAEKWEVCRLGNDDYPDTKLRYAVIDETEDLVSVHYRKGSAKQMAAVPLMVEALEAAFIGLGKHEVKLAKQIKAAIAAAKGE